MVHKKCLEFLFKRAFNNAYPESDLFLNFVRTKSAEPKSAHSIPQMVDQKPQTPTNSWRGPDSMFEGISGLIFSTNHSMKMCMF